MYFNYITYYKNENEETEIYTDTKLKSEIIKKNKEFYKSDTFKRFFL